MLSKKAKQRFLGKELHMAKIAQGMPVVIELVDDRQCQVLPVAVKRRAENEKAAGTQRQQRIANEDARQEQVLDHFHGHHRIVSARVMFRQRLRKIVLEERDVRKL